MIPDPFKPAARVAGQRQDVWSIINEAAERSQVKPMVNMGQGFFGYNVSVVILFPSPVKKRERRRVEWARERDL